MRELDLIEVEIYSNVPKLNNSHLRFLFHNPLKFLYRWKTDDPNKISGGHYELH
jgi:hypothetical protein